MIIPDLWFARDTNGDVVVVKVGTWTAGPHAWECGDEQGWPIKGNYTLLQPVLTPHKHPMPLPDKKLHYRTVAKSAAAMVGHRMRVDMSQIDFARALGMSERKLRRIESAEIIASYPEQYLAENMQ